MKLSVIIIHMIHCPWAMKVYGKDRIDVKLIISEASLRYIDSHIIFTPHMKMDDSLSLHQPHYIIITIMLSQGRLQCDKDL